MNELQHKDFKTQPILEFSNFLKRSSTHIANNMGDKIPPCLTLEEIKKLLELLSFHLTNEFNFPYQLTNISINNFGSFWPMSLT